MITAKTATPSNIYLEIAIMYRMRPEYINEIYAKWPTNNIQRDYILFAKVAIDSPVDRIVEPNPASAPELHEH